MFISIWIQFVSTTQNFLPQKQKMGCCPPPKMVSKNTFLPEKKHTTKKNVDHFRCEKIHPKSRCERSEALSLRLVLCPRTVEEGGHSRDEYLQANELAGNETHGKNGLIFTDP